ncbi:MAG: S9 family peptidase [Bacteroidota bacterium]|nr:S9 family peptidase [Bacteroidota bacterium]
MKSKLFFLFLLAAVSLSAQEKMLTLDNVVFAGRDGIVAQRLPQLNWIANTNEYYYIDRSESLEILMRGKPAEKGSEKKVIDLNELNDLVRHLNIAGVTDFKGFPFIKWETINSFSFETEKNTFRYNTDSKKLSAETNFVYPQGAENFDKSSALNTAFTVDNNLYVKLDKETSKTVAITEEKNENIVYGKSVHREEFGIAKGTFWSPSGNLLAFYRMDQTMVTDYPVMDLTVQPAKANLIKYPMAGATSHEVTVGVYNVATQKTVYLKTEGPKDQYLTNIAWSPDNKYIFITVLNRDQNHLWQNRYNAETGAFEKTLFEETDPKYVHPTHTMLFVPGHPDQFVWQRELVSADNVYGLNALYLYNTDGKKINQLSGTIADCNACYPVNVTDVYGFDAKGTTIYYQAAPLNSCNRQIFASDLKKGSKWAVPNKAGTHTAIFSADKKYYIDTYSSVDVPGIQSVYDASGKEVKVLLTASNPLVNIAPNIRLDMNYFKGSNRVKLFTIKAADGVTDLWCRMILPTNFDSTLKYPAMTYLYNGPNVQLITNSWLGGADLFSYYMSQQGFVVFAIDGRGSDNRGMKFEQATFRNLGKEEVADQEKGAQYLKSLKYVDANRMAVFGWSYGGFVTTSLMVKKPDLYKCGVAGGPVIDWSYYEIMYTERYMDTPQTNPEGYKESNLLNYAGNLKGKLLQIHGTVDDVVVWQHSLMFQKACVDKKTQCDYYVYPGHPHNVRGKDRVHLYTKISEYIIANT